jgi:hypothetical protein
MHRSTKGRANAALLHVGSIDDLMTSGTAAKGHQ